MKRAHCQVVRLLFVFAFIICYGSGQSQDTLSEQSAGHQKYLSSWRLDNDPSDLREIRSGLDVGIENYIFNRGQLFLGFRLELDLQFGNRRHMVSADIPYAISDYSGYNTRMGFGDMRFSYCYRFFVNDSGNSAFQSGITSLTIYAPTGNSSEGLSRNGWIITPGLSLTFRPHPRWAIFPALYYQISADSVYALSIATPPGHLPQPSSIDGPELINSFIIDVPVNYQFPSIETWLMLSPSFMYDLYSSRSAVAVRFSAGKMFTEKFAIRIGFAGHIAGQRSYRYSFNLSLLNYF